MSVLDELGLTEDAVQEASGLPPAPRVAEGDRSEALWQALDFERFVEEGARGGLLSAANVPYLREWAGREVARAGGSPRGGDRLAEGLREHGFDADAVIEQMDAAGRTARTSARDGGAELLDAAIPGLGELLEAEEEERADARHDYAERGRLERARGGR